MSFVKLHGSILDSSIWSQTDTTRLVWITMLAMANENGVVEASVDGLARRAVVSIESCEGALAALLGPDPRSRDGTAGERIEKVPGGWLVLNHGNYRERRTAEQVATAKRVAEHRARKKALEVELAKATVSHGRPAKADAGATGAVTANATPRYSALHRPDNALSPSEAEADTEADADSVPSTEPARVKPARASKPRSPATGPQADRIRHWEAEWARTRLGQPWAWQPKDAVGVSKAIKLAGTDGFEVDRRATRLLESSDPWLAANASPALLASRWNQLAVDVTSNGVPSEPKGFATLRAMAAQERP